MNNLIWNINNESHTKQKSVWLCYLLSDVHLAGVHVVDDGLHLMRRRVLEHDHRVGTFAQSGQDVAEVCRARRKHDLGQIISKINWSQESKVIWLKPIFLNMLCPCLPQKLSKLYFTLNAILAFFIKFYFWIRVYAFISQSHIDTEVGKLNVSG